MAMRNGRQKGRVIRRVVERLRKEYQPVRIIVFGSYAWGRPDRDSDIDLLVVKETRRRFFDRLVDVRRIADPVLRGTPFDVIVITPKELEGRLARGDQFFQQIVSRGKLVYGRG